MKIVLLSFLLIPWISWGQTTLPMKDGKVFYETTDSTTGTESELYIRARSWFVNTFNDANAVLQMDDKEDGIIMGKGATKYDAGNIITGPFPMYLHYTININVKNNKWRIQIYDIYGAPPRSEATYIPEELLKYSKMNKKKLQRIDDDARSTIASFRKAINQKSVADF